MEKICRPAKFGATSGTLLQEKKKEKSRQISRSSWWEGQFVEKGKKKLHLPEIDRTLNLSTRGSGLFFPSGLFGGFVYFFWFFCGGGVAFVVPFQVVILQRGRRDRNNNNTSNVNYSPHPRNVHACVWRTAIRRWVGGWVVTRSSAAAAPLITRPQFLHLLLQTSGTRIILSVYY